jgi:LacI family transcriptional regulator
VPEKKKSRAATISDVAHHAGVSPMTVSRVINGEPSVRPSTRALVEASIAALDYAPNSAARALAGARPIRIGLLYSNPSAAYLSEFLVGGLDYASRGNVELVVEKCDAGVHEKESAQQLIRRRIDGVVVPAPLCDSKIVIDTFADADVPTITVGSGQPDPRVSAVGIDDHKAAYEMTRHLLALGHQRIGFIVGNPNQTASALRLVGYRDALEEAGLPIDDALIVEGLFTYRSGLDAAEKLLVLSPAPTAIFASNDDMAAAAVAVAHRCGLDVPSDLTVCGFDDSALATTIWPELTTIRQPIADMSVAALDLLVREVKSRRAGTRPDAERQQLEHSLIRRQSDAAPRRRPPAISAISF